MSTEQQDNLDAILRQLHLPVGVTVTTATLGGVPAAEITPGEGKPRRVVWYFRGGVYVAGTPSKPLTRTDSSSRLRARP